MSATRCGQKTNMEPLIEGCPSHTYGKCGATLLDVARIGLTVAAMLVNRVDGERQSAHLVLLSRPVRW